MDYVYIPVQALRPALFRRIVLLVQVVYLEVPCKGADLGSAPPSRS